MIAVRGRRQIAAYTTKNEAVRGAAEGDARYWRKKLGGDLVVEYNLRKGQAANLAAPGKSKPWELVVTYNL